MSTLTLTNAFSNATTADATEVNSNFDDVKDFVDTHLLHVHSTIEPTRVGVNLHKTASSIATDSETAITWADEEEDTDGFWSSGTTVTIPTGKAGIYVITFWTTGSFTSSGGDWVNIAVTSSLTNVPDNFRMPMEALGDIGTVTAVTPLAAADSFTCKVYHDSGSSVSFESWVACYRTTA
jgi:hypothetical protein